MEQICSYSQEKANDWIQEMKADMIGLEDFRSLIVYFLNGHDKVWVRHTFLHLKMILICQREE